MVVVGAGPYGLSVAAHLRAAGVPVRVFGEVMGSWRHAMATGMFLKSTPAATDLSAPVPGGRLADFCRETGEPELTELTPIPCETFVRYGMWFTQRYVGTVESARITAVEQDGAGFCVRLEGDEEIETAAVVVATGLATLAHLPDILLSLAPGGPGLKAALSHTSQHTDLSRYAGRRVAVVGGGQSALESAALLHEACCRRRGVGACLPGALGRAPSAAAAVDAAAGPAGFPAGHRLDPGRSLPRSWHRSTPEAAARMQLFRRALGPSGGWWLRERVEGVVPVRTACRVEQARLAGDEVQLRLGGRGNGLAELVVDHVLAATGYRLDVDALPFLTPPVRQAVARVPGVQAPRLSGAFESSVPGLYFTGSLAAPTFGPMLRFVAGTEFAARRITERLVRQDLRR